MLFQGGLTVLATALWVQAAQPRHLPRATATATTTATASPESCAQVSSEWAAQKQAHAAAGTPDMVVVDGQVAYDCLNSVPLNEADAVRLVRSIQPFVQWQTTRAYLKNPPADYPFPAFDMDTAFEDIINRVQTGGYRNEYEFQKDLYWTFYRAKDGHFRYMPDLLTAAIEFRRGDLALVSVSLDGASLPNIYVLADIQLHNADSSFTPSPVSSLNGEDAVAAVEELSLLGFLHDRDALYNAMFYSPALAAKHHGDWQGLYGGSERYGFLWPGPSTAVQFANGTRVDYKTVARVVGDFTAISDGPSFYAKYCTGAKPVSQVAKPSPPANASMARPAPRPDPAGLRTAPPARPFGYPTPEIITHDQSAAGYFLPDTDVAVLALPDFGPDVPAEWQHTIEVFLRNAKAAGKTKLIVDVSANNGGYVGPPSDAFRQLFPDIVEVQYDRFRSNRLLQIAARQFSALIPRDFDPETSDNATLISLSLNYQNYRYDLDANLTRFVSVHDKFDPVPVYGDEFTPLTRWDFNNALDTINATFGSGYDITGYRSRRNLTTQPFPAENIILLHGEGYCASGCSIFSEFMRLQGGVRSVTLGGLPRLDAQGNVPIIQNYGGTKGSGNQDLCYFAELAQFSLRAQGNDPATTSGDARALSAADVAFLARSADTYAANRSTDATVNVRDHILRDHVADGLPAQFVREPADCRLFYTPRSAVDPAEQWRLVADAAWGRGRCVAGSLRRPAAAGG